jgi:hypothetical protein
MSVYRSSKKVECNDKAVGKDIEGSGYKLGVVQTTTIVVGIRGRCQEHGG